MGLLIGLVFGVVLTILIYNAKQVAHEKHLNALKSKRERYFASGRVCSEIINSLDKEIKQLKNR